MSAGTTGLVSHDLHFTGSISNYIVVRYRTDHSDGDSLMWIVYYEY